MGSKSRIHMFVRGVLDARCWWDVGVSWEVQAIVVTIRLVLVQHVSAVCEYDSLPVFGWAVAPFVTKVFALASVELCESRLARSDTPSQAGVKDDVAKRRSANGVERMKMVPVSDGTIDSVPVGVGAVGGLPSRVADHIAQKGASLRWCEPPRAADIDESAVFGGAADKDEADPLLGASDCCLSKDEVGDVLAGKSGVHIADDLAADTQIMVALACRRLRAVSALD